MANNSTETQNAQTTEDTAQVHPAQGTEGHTETAGGKHATGVFPPMDTTKYPSQLFWLIVFFGLMYWLMKRILPKIGAILDNRKARIDGDLAKAKSLQEDTQSAIASYEKALADARAGANDIAKVTRERVTKEIDAEQAKVSHSLATRISEAEGRIAKAKATAMESVESIAAETADEIVKSLAGALKVTPRKAAKA